MIKRKNIRSLSQDERNDFVNAVLKLKSIGIYDKYTELHQEAMMMQSGGFEKNLAHYGPIFLPWHREYLRRFEKDLNFFSQRTDLFIPYWDWTEDFENPQESPLWKDEFMGGNGVKEKEYLVTSGRFSHWGLSRQFGPKKIFGLRKLTLPEKKEIEGLMNVITYDTPEWNTSSLGSFRNLLEGSRTISRRAEPETHNRVHLWVGGDMSSEGSPSDPIFYLHHSNIDRIWASWQNKHFKNRLSDSYLPREPISEQGRILKGHSINEYMFPWVENNQISEGLRSGKVTIQCVLDHEKLGYSYEVYE
ncbi:MAG: tyrosinase family protein [Candidatus Nitrosocosmicus sp.]